MRDPIQEFMDFNRPFARCNPAMVRFKIARMAEGPFAFFRGTFHLFARDVLVKVHDPLPLFSAEGPELDLVGDIHSENYGSFKATDDVVHYDVNDFDETTTGRFDFDVCRAAVSWFLAAREGGDVLADAVTATLAGVAAYIETVTRLVKKGKAPDLDVSEARPSGCGPVDELVPAGAAAKRPAFIGRLTERRRQGPPPAAVAALLQPARRRARPRPSGCWPTTCIAGRRPPIKGYYNVEDVCGRVSGIGSMGRMRYVLLISGKGSGGRPQRAAGVQGGAAVGLRPLPPARRRRGGFAARAERVIAVQKLSQAASNGHLGFAVDGGLSFQAREIGPADARVDTHSLNIAGAPGRGDPGAGPVPAHPRPLRPARRRPSQTRWPAADADAFCQRVLCFALGYADIVHRDWSRFAGTRATSTTSAAGPRRNDEGRIKASAAPR